MSGQLTPNQRWALEELLALFQQRFTGPVEFHMEEGGVRRINGNTKWTKKPPAQTPPHTPRLTRIFNDT